MYSSFHIKIQVRMETPRTVARAEEQKIKGSITELMILQQSINDKAAPVRAEMQTTCSLTCYNTYLSIGT